MFYDCDCDSLCILIYESIDLVHIVSHIYIIVFHKHKNENFAFKSYQFIVCKYPQTHKYFDDIY